MANHLIFEFNTTRYAIAADAVRTIFWLPELAPVQDLPPYFVGLINLHGDVIAIVDLGQRFGHPAKPYRLDQSVILLEQDGYVVGLVADAVHDLLEIAPADTAPYVQLEQDDPSGPASVIGGTLKWQDTVLILLDSIALLRLVMQAPDEPSATTQPTDRFAELTAAQRARLRQRTQQLVSIDAPLGQAGHVYALVRIGNGHYAIALEHVAEFIHLDTCIAIPCCPPHILGCVNLRGAILTVIDLAPQLQGAPLRDYKDIVVLRLDEQRLGLAVHQIIDIQTFEANALSPLTGQAYGHPQCKWMLQLDDGVAGVLDVDALLQQGLLEVNEQV
ncbi:chemotaxis protein CheW [uncultured Thiodictyon sp.]|uniref:chemotaxis protein CheW n=1 Tax=uncultured Thiodictyon sp. TaxID=1846217 RepID=UPI0025E60239|nr:chemotaxis protein CheW [uncultured Thiodictyon sp.]